MKLHAAIADTWVIGWSLSAPALLDEEEDTLLFANGTANPIPFTFHNAEGLTISYNGSPVESLQLAPGAVFVGAVKAGNITPLSGELAPIPRFPVEETAFHKLSVSVPITTSIPDGFNPKVYNKAQRKELNRINEAFKAVRAAKKLSRSQEEDL